MNNALGASSSSRDGSECLIDLKKVCETQSSKLEPFFEAFEDKLYDVQHRSREFQLTKRTARQLAIKVGEADKALAASQEHVQYL